MSEISDHLAPFFTKHDLKGVLSNRGRNVCYEGEFEGHKIKVSFGWLSKSRDPGNRTGDGGRIYTGHSMRVILPTEVHTRFFAHREPKGASKVFAKMNKLAKLEKMEAKASLPGMDFWTMEPAWADKILTDDRFPPLLKKLIDALDNEGNAGFKLGPEGELETSSVNHIKKYSENYLGEVLSTLCKIAELLESHPRPRIVPKISKREKFAKEKPGCYALIALGIFFSVIGLLVGFLVLLAVIIGK